MLQQAQEQSGALIEKKAQQLRCDLATGTAEVMGDATRLVQVFANLLNNAAKCTGEGGALRLELHLIDARNAVVSIHDNGVGMDPQAIADLFEPFVQAPGAASNAERGLGLGLAIVRRIVELHGGQVGAQSAGPGAGSTFTVAEPG